MISIKMLMTWIYALTPGILVLGFGIMLMILRIRFLHVAHRIQGQVISIEERYPFGRFTGRGGQAMPCYIPKIAFFTEDGLRYEFVDHSASRFLSSAVGTSVPVLYDPDNPHKACIAHWLTVWSRYAGIIAIGLVLLVFGLLII